MKGCGFAMEWSAKSAREMRKHAIGLLILALLFVVMAFKLSFEVAMTKNVMENVLSYGMCTVLALVSVVVAIHAGKEIGKFNRVLTAHAKAEIKKLADQDEDEILDEDVSADASYVTNTETFVKADS